MYFLYTFLAIGMCMMIILVIIFLIVTRYYLRKKYKEYEKKEKQYQTIQNEQNRVISIYEKNIGYYHDMKNHLNILYQYLNEGEHDKALAFLNKIREPIIQLANKNSTNNKVIDIVLNYINTESINNNIKLTVDTNMVNDLMISDDCLSSIFFNILDNAVDACKLLPKDKRWISVKILRNNDMLFFYVRNSMLNAPVLEEGRIKTHKANKIIHGTGLSNIKRIIKEYNGYLDYHYTENEFEISINISCN